MRCETNRDGQLPIKLKKKRLKSPIQIPVKPYVTGFYRYLYFFDPAIKLLKR